MLKIERRDAVLLLTLDHPAKRNALHPDLIRGLSEALSQIGRDTSLTAVVLTGAGSTFCAGHSSCDCRRCRVSRSFQ